MWTITPRRHVRTFINTASYKLSALRELNVICEMFRIMEILCLHIAEVIFYRAWALKWKFVWIIEGETLGKKHQR